MFIFNKLNELRRVKAWRDGPGLKRLQLGLEWVAGGLYRPLCGF